MMRTFSKASGADTSSQMPKRVKEEMIVLSLKSKVESVGKSKPPFEQEEASQFLLDVLNLPAENWTKRLTDSFDKEALFCVRHSRGSEAADQQKATTSAGQRRVWIQSIGSAAFRFDQTERDGRAKTLISVFRPGRIFAWMWSDRPFFSMTGLIDCEPCFWVFSENDSLNDEVRKKVFRKRSEALKFTLGRWREMFPDECRKTEPQTNEVFLDNFKSLIEFEFDVLGTTREEAAQNLRKELEFMRNMDEKDQRKVIECFASMFVMETDIDKFQALMNASTTCSSSNQPCGEDLEGATCNNSDVVDHVDLIHNQQLLMADEQDQYVFVQPQPDTESDEIVIDEVGCASCIPPTTCDDQVTETILQKELMRCMKHDQQSSEMALFDELSCGSLDRFLLDHPYDEFDVALVLNDLEEDAFLGNDDANSIQFALDDNEEDNANPF